MPAGIQRGKPLDLVVTGTQLASPTGVSLGIPAKITIPTEDKNGQDATKFKVRIEASRRHADRLVSVPYRDAQGGVQPARALRR